MVDLLLDAHDQRKGEDFPAPQRTAEPGTAEPLPEVTLPSPTAPSPLFIDGALAWMGGWLMRHQRWVWGWQWAIIAFYAFTVTVPAFLPHPEREEHIWTNLTLFAQFLFWGIWWPFVLLSMVVFGRLWCGVLCPEGATSEAAARHGLGRAVPQWIRWKGWGFVAFASTTAYGQFVSVYQYPKPALLILGGSTVAAIAIGFTFGRNKRVWCRYLCPVHGVFALLAKLSPFHYHVNHEAWDKAPKGSYARVNCAPMVPIRTMRGSTECHMCGRCSGFRGAVTLARRTPGSEIVHVAGAKPKPWESWLIIFGMMGLTTGAFHWASSDLYIDGKQAVAQWLIERDIMWPITATPPWWLLTSYPDQNDVMSPLDGAMLAVYLLAVTFAIGGAVCLLLAAASRVMTPVRTGEFRRAFHHLAQSLIPVAACMVFLGLFATTLTMLHVEGLNIPYIKTARTLLMAAASLWGVALAWSITSFYTKRMAARLGATAFMAVAAFLGFAAWAFPF